MHVRILPNSEGNDRISTLHPCTNLPQTKCNQSALNSTAIRDCITQPVLLADKEIWLRIVYQCCAFNLHSRHPTFRFTPPGLPVVGHKSCLQGRPALTDIKKNMPIVWFECHKVPQHTPFLKLESWPVCRRSPPHSKTLIFKWSKAYIHATLTMIYTWSESLQLSNSQGRNLCEILSLVSDPKFLTKT